MSKYEIPELGLLDDLEQIAERYQQTYGVTPTNISVWDPAPAVLKDLAPHLPSARDFDLINYTFSYEMQERFALLMRLGFDPNKTGCLVTHSGSAGIVAAVNWLKKHSCHNVLILAPRYFTVPYTLSALGISWNIEYMRRSAGGHFLFPKMSNFKRSCHNAIWVTNPIYCTSVDYDLTELRQFIYSALENDQKIVLDECLAECGRRISPLFINKNIVSIHAPHKSICMNGIKFAAIVFHLQEQDHFDRWCDVWNGCVPTSSLIAVRHFLSHDFDRYHHEFRALVAHQHARVRSIAAHSSAIELDPTADGYLITIYATNIAARFGLDLDFLEAAARDTGAIFISGARNELDPSAGLSFRVNLLALNTEALGAATRLCEWLEKESFIN